MADIPAILTSISTAMDIAKTLREADQFFEKAELRLKLSEVVSGLADAKIAIADLREELAESQAKVTGLETALELKDELVRFRDAYYRKGPDGNWTGYPYCLRCWDEAHKARPLVNKPATPFSICPTCKSEYGPNRAPNQE